MWAPALGNVVAHLVTDEGHENHLPRLHVRERWRVWLAAWARPVVLTLLGPGATGVLVALPWLVVAAWLLADADRLAPVEPSG